MYSPNELKTCTKCQEQKRFGGNEYCLKCKVEENEKVFLEDPFFDKWESCNPMGKPYFVKNLDKLFRYSGKSRLLSDENKFRKKMRQLFGDTVVERYCALLSQLFIFANVEYNFYRFSPIEFSVVRFEKHFESIQPCAMDFWLTLSCTYGLLHYTDDLIKLEK